ncbi:LysR family transcriptional regulator [Zavarzinia compransoris]|uniref:LysR family transcriptional regulator n=1 Tax=Zavarzinia marina TaxID=2911065 RepID=UPI001F18BCC4|nr:LysR family transcriptional regulator [Zavarzinia marina]MCF4165773.1 LysR family transcriptional regulator [Zavarzinia marina]
MTGRLDWDDLRYLLAVSRAGRVSLAAKRLGVDHSTVIRRIGVLEEALGARLVDRGPTGYDLTDRGVTLVAAAEQMETLTLGALDQLAGADAQISGAVRIGAPDGFGSLFLAGRLGGLSALHPGLELQLVAMPRVFSLSKREADLAVSLSPPRSGRLVASKLTDYHLGLYGARGYLAARGLPAGVDDLPAHTFIGYIEDLLYTPELDYLAEIHPGIRASFRSAGLIAQLQAAKSGFGLCVLPHFVAAGEPDLTRVLPGAIGLTRSFYLVTHSDLKDLPRIRAVSRFITEETRGARALFNP